MCGERERQTGHHRRQPCDGRRAVTEMRVDVPHVTGGDDRIGQRSSLEKLLERRCPWKRPAPFAGPDGVAECGRRGACGPDRMTPHLPAEWTDKPQGVDRKPSDESHRGDRCGVRQMDARRADRVDDRMREWLVRTLDDEKPKRHPPALEPVNLAGDECLRQTRKRLEHVSDGPGSVMHRPPPTGARSDRHTTPGRSAVPPPRVRGSPAPSGGVRSRRELPAIGQSQSAIRKGSACR